MALPIFQRTVVDDEGNIVAGATVTVLRESTGLAANIYSDRAGIAPLSNPFTTGSDGLARFYAAPGEYRIQVSGPSTSADWRYQILGGTASTYDVTESATDTSAGGNGQPRVMRVGYSGLTNAPINMTAGINIDDPALKQGRYSIYKPSVTGVLPDSSGGLYQRFVLDVINENSGVSDANIIQELSANRYNLRKKFFRLYNKTSGTWTGWQEILHTGNTGSIVTEDYEEGTWTPSASTGLSSVTTLGGQNRYVKIGADVSGYSYLQVTKSGSGASFTVSGLPFVNGSSYGVANISFLASANKDLNFFRSYVSAGGSSIIFEAIDPIPDGTSIGMIIKYSYLT